MSKQVDLAEAQSPTHTLHVLDVARQAVIAAILPAVRLAAAKRVEIDNAIGVSQSRKIRVEIIVRDAGAARNKDQRFPGSLAFIPQSCTVDSYIVAGRMHSGMVGRCCLCSGGGQIR